MRAEGIAKRVVSRRAEKPNHIAGPFGPSALAKRVRFLPGEMAHRTEGAMAAESTHTPSRVSGLLPPTATPPAAATSGGHRRRALRAYRSAVPTSRAVSSRPGDRTSNASPFDTFRLGRPHRE